MGRSNLANALLSHVVRNCPYVPIQIRGRAPEPRVSEWVRLRLDERFKYTRYVDFPSSAPIDVEIASEFVDAAPHLEKRIGNFVYWAAKSQRTQIRRSPSRNRGITGCPLYDRRSGANIVLRSFFRVLNCALCSGATCSSQRRPIWRSQASAARAAREARSSGASSAEASRTNFVVQSHNFGASRTYSGALRLNFIKRQYSPPATHSTR